MRTRNRAPWTPSDDDQLRELAKVPDNRLAEIAAALQRSPEAVRLHAGAIGVQLPKQKRRGSLLA